MVGDGPPLPCQCHCPYRNTFLCIWHEEFLILTTSFYWFSNDVLSSLYICVCCACLVCAEGVGR